MYEDIIHVKSFEQAADVVAQDFVKTMKEEGFESFKAMARCYMWEPQDTREEIQSILESMTDAWIYDDGSHVVINNGWNDMYYRDFKKMVLNRVDELLKQ